MNWLSTRDKRTHVPFEEAAMRGLAPDGGLYVPENITPLPNDFWRRMPAMSFREMSLEVALHLLQGAQAKNVEAAVLHATSFDAPLVKLAQGFYALELFHGPTFAFKDFGARFLASMLGSLAIQQGKEITILVATSGDTGSAVANGFLGVQGTRVIVLYPEGRVSDLQECQFTTMGRNVQAIKVKGSFDDCQRMVKQAFSDSTLTGKVTLASANSINVARLIPQTFYYFRMYQQWIGFGEKEPLVVSVPSGNFGNLTAGIMAMRMGLPVHRFIASTNINDVVPEFLFTGSFGPRPSVQTISNAMDVGNPSNFERLQYFLGADAGHFSEVMEGKAFNDDETREAMKELRNRYGYVADPHGAVAYLGLKKESGVSGVFLETAHPAKFNEVVEAALHEDVVIPSALKEMQKRPRNFILLNPAYEELKLILLSE